MEYLESGAENTSYGLGLIMGLVICLIAEAFIDSHQWQYVDIARNRIQAAIVYIYIYIYLHKSIYNVYLVWITICESIENQQFEQIGDRNREDSEYVFIGCI